MKIFTGKVISVKMQKTAAVSIERHYRHPLYGKILKRNSKILAANFIGAVVGDLVTIIETRPISKSVCFKIGEILTKAQIIKKTPKKTPGVKKNKKEAKK